MTFQSNEFPKIGVPTLEDVMQRIAVEPSLNDRQKREILSALNTVAKWRQLPLSQIPATHEHLRDLFEGANFGALGVSRKRKQNVQSLAKRALAVAAVPTASRKGAAPLSAKWQGLRDKIENRPARECCGRFARFCCERGIAPEGVDDAVVESYRQALAEQDLATRPEVATQAVVRVWNRTASERRDWPQRRLTPLLRRETYTLRWDEVSRDLVAGLETYLAILGGADPLHDKAPPRPLKHRSIQKRRYEFLQLISGMQHQGVPVGDLHTLADLCNPERVKKGLSFFIERHRKRHGENSDPATSTMIAGMADAVRALGKHYVGASPAVVTELTRIANRLNRRQRGMTEKNRSRLAQLDSPLVEQRFLSYPIIEMQKLAKTNTFTRLDAVRYGELLAIQILILAPMRVENLAQLDLQRNFVWPPHRQGEIGIVIARNDVKNSVPLDYKIPERWVGIVYAYLDRFRPVLVKSETTALFPNPRGRSKRPDTISKQMASLIQKELGIEWNPHIFRHLAARLYLRAHPGDYEGVRRLLAHLSAETTYRSYEGSEMRPAVDRYDALIESKVAPILPPLKARSRR